MKNQHKLNSNEINEKIDAVINIGNSLVFKKFDINEFEKFKKTTNQIVNAVLLQKPNDIQLKTCELIIKTNIEDFRLNIIRRIFAPYAETGIIGFPNNSKNQMIRRFCLNINSKLPILKTKKPQTFPF